MSTPTLCCGGGEEAVYGVAAWTGGVVEGGVVVTTVATSRVMKTMALQTGLQRIAPRAGKIGKD